MKILFLILIFPFCYFSQIKNDNTKIGNQTWMSKNLDVTHFRNGDSIKQVKTDKEWAECAKKQIPAWCYYNNDPISGKKKWDII